MTSSGYLRAAKQPPPLEGYDLFSEDRPLVEALSSEGGAECDEECSAFGRLCGASPLELGRLANENPPVLRRDDEVEFHPAWHELLGLGVERGLHAFPWPTPLPVPTSRGRRSGGVGPAAPLPGEPAQVALGGREQRQRAGPPGGVDWDPESVGALLAEIELAADADLRLDAALARRRPELENREDAPHRARRVADSRRSACKALSSSERAVRGGGRILCDAPRRRARSKLRHAAARDRLRSHRRTSLPPNRRRPGRAAEHGQIDMTVEILYCPT